MQKPTIIAICGKSGAGKDAYLNHLMHKYSALGCKVNRIVSNTTRPRRIGETDGVSYNFVNSVSFFSHDYLEFSMFNGWTYGTPRSAIVDDAVNIGVFNPGGILNIYNRYSDIYDIYVIYIDAAFIKRLSRAIIREKKVKKEYFRRAVVDFIDFSKFKKKMKENNIYLHVIDNNNDDFRFKMNKSDANKINSIFYKKEAIQHERD